MNRPFTREPYPKWYRDLPVQILLPWRNLGALGVRVGRFYADIYSRRKYSRGFPFGLFISTGRKKFWCVPGRIRVEG